MSTPDTSTSYLQWLAADTVTTWWHDSADPEELETALTHGATGVTTNPVLARASLLKNRDFWSERRQQLCAASAAEEPLVQLENIITYITDRFGPLFAESKGRFGYVCAQTAPSLAYDRQGLIDAAERFHAWAPNVTVKFPNTRAGLDAMADCTARGISVTMTVSYTVSQVVAVAERYREARARAEAGGVVPGRCFAVIMIGRLDDYLREMAQDAAAGLDESDIRQAGLAVTKRAYGIFRERGYEAELIVAALRGTHQMTELAGADIVMSIHPTYQALLLDPSLHHEERIDVPVPADVVGRLSRLPEFVRAYEEEGMAPEEFAAFGLVQKTLAQFLHGGWKLFEEAAREAMAATQRRSALHTS